MSHRASFEVAGGGIFSQLLLGRLLRTCSSALLRPRESTKDSMAPQETVLLRRCAFVWDMPTRGTYVQMVIHPSGSGRLRGESPDGRTLAVRPPVFPSAGTFSVALAARASCCGSDAHPPRPLVPTHTHPAPAISWGLQSALQSSPNTRETTGSGHPRRRSAWARTICSSRATTSSRSSDG